MCKPSYDYQKTCRRGWDLNMVMPWHFGARGCLQLLEQANDDASQKIITGDESWVYSIDIEKKVQSSQWVGKGLQLMTFTLENACKPSSDYQRTCRRDWYLNCSWRHFNWKIEQASNCSEVYFPFGDLIIEKSLPATPSTSQRWWNVHAKIIMRGASWVYSNDIGKKVNHRSELAKDL